MTTNTTYQSKPSFAHLLLTLSCNLACPQCFVDAGRRMPNEMNTLELLDLADQLVEMDVHTLHVEGGEALLVPEASLILEKLGRLRDLLLVTNGTLVTKEVAQRLARVGMKQVALSLDGATADTHNHFRPNTYAKIVDAIGYLRDVGIDVRISATLMKPNVREATLLLEKCLAWGVHVLNFDAFDMIGRGLQHPELKLGDDDWSFLASELFPRALAVSDQMQLKVAIPSEYVEFLGINRDDPHYEWMWCTSGVSQFSILPDGSMIPCFVMVTTPGYVVGNVKTEPLQEIWEESASLRYHRTVRGKERCPMGYQGHLFFSNTR